MHKIKTNEWDAAKPANLHAYSHRFFIFLDSHRPFYRREFTDDRSRFKVQQNLFCSDLQPHCIKDAMLLTKDSIHSFPALLERFATIIERVTHCVEATAHRHANTVASTTDQKKNNNHHNNHNNSSNQPDTDSAKQQSHHVAGGSRPAPVSGAARPQQNTRR